MIIPFGFMNNRSIITSGLILNWDIQNPNSYGGSGTTITDLQSNSNGFITGSIEYTASNPNGGSPNYLNVTGGATEYIRLVSTLDSNLSPANTGTSISVFVWIYPTAAGVILSELGQTTPNLALGWHYSQIEIISISGGFDLKFRVFDISSITSSTTIVANRWYYIGFTYEYFYSSALNIYYPRLKGYLNGVEVATSPAYFTTQPDRQTPNNNGPASPINATNLYYSLGAPDSNNLGDGTGSSFRFGGMEVYNRALTVDDVLNNYNVTKSKYGL